MDPKLFEAAVSSDEKLLEGLLATKHSSILLQKTFNDNSVLHIAGHERVAEKIINVNSSLLYWKNADGDTPLHTAARVGRPEMVKLLLNSAKNNNIIKANPEELEAGEKLIKMVNMERDTVLHHAARNGHAEVAKLLIEECCELTCYVNRAGESPLFLAVDGKHLDIAESILSTPQCSYDGRDGMNALHAMVIRMCTGSQFGGGLSKIVPRFLYCLRRYLYNKDNRYELKILRNKYAGLIKELVNKSSSAAKYEVDNIKGWTPLNYAARFDAVDLVELLVSADRLLAYKRDKEGMFAFHIAAKYESIGTMRKLITTYPDICVQLNNKGQTALHVAVENGKKYALKYLLTFASETTLLNLHDQDGNTPLLLAAECADFAILKLLADDNRVNTRAINKKGLTTIDIIHSCLELSESAKDFITWKLGKMGGLSSLKQEVLSRDDGMKKGETHETKSEKHSEKDEGNQLEESSLRKESKRKTSIRNMSNSASWDQRMSDSELKEAANNNILVATIIATVTFSAVLQIPGGYESDGPHKGFPTRRNSIDFFYFLMWDSLALSLSCASIFIHLFASLELSPPHFRFFFKLVALINFSSIVAMGFAFNSAIDLVAAKSLPIKLAANIGIVVVLAGFIIVWRQIIASSIIYKLVSDIIQAKK